MGWDHTARERKLAPIGQYRPETIRVVVHDTFQQYRLRVAAQAIRNGMSVPEFLLYCAGYVLSHHRQLKQVRSIFRKGQRDILAAVAAAPVTPGPWGPGERTSEEVRKRAREDAFEQFARWAEGQL